MPHVHSPARANARRLVAVLGLSAVILVIELVGGLASNSLALLADAGHVFTDVAGISLALLAIWIGSRPASGERTYGYLRLEILAAVANAVLLFAVAAFILYEAWQRLSAPPEVASGLMLAVALVGLLINAVSLWLLHDAQARSLTMRGAYLEVLGDLAGSAVVVAAAIVIALTGRTGADALASAIIAVLILPRTWGLLRDAIDVLLEATPKGVEMADVRRHILEAPGVADVHDLHAWTITSGVNVVSAHVVLEPEADGAAVLDFLCDCLSGDFDIEHSTFQLESSDRRRLEAVSHG
ncbi:MAG: cation diffusion facilitator family transporter [Chloroflexota bacterium]